MAVIFIIAYLRSILRILARTDEFKYLILTHLVWFILYNHTRIHVFLAHILKQGVLSNWKHPPPNEYFIPTFFWNQEKKQSTKHSRRKNIILLQMAAEAPTIPLLTPYKLDRFNLSHRYTIHLSKLLLLLLLLLLLFFLF